jgi:Transposase DDE domain group 1
MARRKGWTAAKRKRARRKAEAALRERRRIIKANRDRRETAYAGMVPMVEYARQELKLEDRLQRGLHMTKGQNSVYSPLNEAMAYLGCQVAGILRLGHIDRLIPESAVAQTLNLPQWMSENTQQRFLKRATEETLAGIDGIAQRLIVDEELQGGPPGPIEVDGDVTGIPQRARKREGVKPGYCEGRARPCYQQPRVTVNGLSWWSDLRSGNDACMDLPEQTLKTGSKLAREYPKREILCRLDGYWASRATLRMYQAAARDQANLEFLLPIHSSDMKAQTWVDLVEGTQTPWKRVNSTTRIRELGRVRPWGEGTEPVRAVAVQREEKRRGKRGRTVTKVLRYLIVVSVERKRLGTLAVFRRYHQRQREEFSFKDGKQSLSTAKMPTMKLMANRMHVKMVALAQVMMRLFARKFVPHPGPYGPTCKTIREKVVAVGGKNTAGPGGGDHPDLLRLPVAALFAGQGDR